MDGKIGRDRSDFEAGGISRFPAVRIYAFAFIHFHGFTVLRGESLPPWSALRCRRTPFCGETPQRPPRVRVRTGFAVTG